MAYPYYPYNQPNQMPSQGMGNILQRFNQFRQTFQGNPQQMVQQMLNSGRITQQQYDNAVQIANQIYRQFHA